ncbi:hypothetical protein MJI47_27970, partial [Salmonella enterica subsp. enterica serovar Kentucky]|nr:hypothetical protein [Salmonella enterica subsp. enterica serovar Kentucky]
DKTTTGDGIVAGLQVLAAMVRNHMSLHDLCSGMKMFPQILVKWRRHTGVKNLYFRIINMFGKPVGGDKKGGGHGHLHCYLIMIK